MFFESRTPPDMAMKLSGYAAGSPRTIPDVSASLVTYTVRDFPQNRVSIRELKSARRLFLLSIGAREIQSVREFRIFARGVVW